MIFISCFSRRTSQHMKPATKEQRDKGSLYENGHYDGRHHYVLVSIFTAGYEGKPGK